MTVLPDRPCATTDILHSPIGLSEQWRRQLRHSIDALRVTPTTRTSIDQEYVDQRVRTAFGADTRIVVQQWETAHGDLHWNNLHCPEFALLDWELWGRGPAGTDAATLYCYSLLTPDIAEQVHDVFADLLDSPAGHTAQLVAAARLLTRASHGDHPELVAPLRRHARMLIEHDGNGTGSVR